MDELKPLIANQDYPSVKRHILDNPANLEKSIEILLSHLENVEKESFFRLVELETLKGRFGYTLETATGHVLDMYVSYLIKRNKDETDVELRERYVSEISKNSKPVEWDFVRLELVNTSLKM
jgi:hypothetical protein